MKSARTTAPDDRRPGERFQAAIEAARARAREASHLSAWRALVLAARSFPRGSRERAASLAEACRELSRAAVVHPGRPREVSLALRCGDVLEGVATGHSKALRRAVRLGRLSDSMRVSWHFVPGLDPVVLTPDEIAARVTEASKRPKRGRRGARRLRASGQGSGA